MIVTLTFLTVLLLLVTLVPLSRHPHWIVRGMDFPRLQFAIAAAILLVCHGLFLDVCSAYSIVLIAATVLCLAWQLWWILPYTVIWPVEVKRASNRDTKYQLTILTANVLTSNRNADSLIELVKKYQPDVLVTLESDQWWQDQLSALEQTMPFSVQCPLDNLYGMHVYSRLSLHHQEVCYLVEENVPSIHASITLRSGHIIRAHFLHPAPPSPTENPKSAERDAELVTVARSVAETNQPVIVTGDLNDVAWSPTTRLFRKISGLLDPRIGRGGFNTFHAEYPVIRWPLDHIFHSQHFTLREIKRLPSIGSDHFPLFTWLAFTPENGCDQQGIDAQQEEHQWARKISAEEGTSKNDVPTPGMPRAANRL